MAADARRALGDAGEDAVARWYVAAGYDVVDRNWRCREGELDLVLARRGVLVFCEVKTRRTTAFGVPAEAVTATKQRRLRTIPRESGVGSTGSGKPRLKRRLDLRTRSPAR